MNPFTLYRTQLKGLILLLLPLLFGACNEYVPVYPTVDHSSLSESFLTNYTQSDSLLEVLQDQENTTARLDSLFLWTELIRNYDEVAAIGFAEEANRISLEKGITLGRAASNYYLALLYGRQQILGESLEGPLADAEIARSIFEEENEERWLIETVRLQGNLSYRHREYELAFGFLTEAQQLAYSSLLAENIQQRLLGEINHDLGNFFHSLDTTTTTTLEAYNTALEFYEAADHSSARARVLGAIGRVYMEEKDFQRADSLFQLGLEYADRRNDTQLKVTLLELSGRLAYMVYRTTEEQNDIERSIGFYRQCLNLARENIYFLNDRLAKSYHLWAAREPETELEHIDSAVVYYAKALQKAPEEGAFNVMPRLVNNMTSLCNYKAETYGEDCETLLGQTYNTLLNETYAKVNTMALEDLENASQKRRAFEKQVLEAENKRRIRNQWIIAGAGLLFASLIFLIIVQFLRQKRLVAKMEALRAQINPHFISNSLNAIESLVNLDQKAAASKYIIHFSRLTRRILNASREVTSSLQDELKILEHFLALEQLRFRDKLEYKIQIDPDVPAQQILMPSMILQPYAENAIWHGIKPKEGPGHLLVEVKKDQKDIVITLEDDGVGRTKAAELKAASVLKQKSVGMQINHERLQAAGRVKGSKIEIQDLYDPQGKAAGTRVVLRFPIKYKK